MPVQHLWLGMNMLLTQPCVFLTCAAVFLLEILQCLRNNCTQKMKKIKLGFVNSLICVVLRLVQDIITFFFYQKLPRRNENFVYRILISNAICFNIKTATNIVFHGFCSISVMSRSSSSNQDSFLHITNTEQKVLPSLQEFAI